MKIKIIKVLKGEYKGRLLVDIQIDNVKKRYSLNKNLFKAFKYLVDK